MLSQTPQGYHRVHQQLSATGEPPAATLVVLEATGSYWITLAVTLYHRGSAVSVVNPSQVPNYATSLPRRSKTDALDAQLLAQFARERRPATWTPPPAVSHELRQRLVARDALLEMRQPARNHRHALIQWPVQIDTVTAQLDAVIVDRDTRIATLEQQIATVVRAQAWSESALRLQTMHSIGPLPTAWLVVATLNFQACASSAAVVAYAGLAPVLPESRRRVRERPPLGHGGNKRLRTALDRATINAARCNPVIRAFSARLRAAGKPKNGARCAAARKLLIAWAVVHSGEPFDPHYGRRHKHAA